MFSQKTPLLHFGPFTVDPSGHCLLRDGVRVVIQEQPYRILLALLEEPGKVVTRERLRLRLWGEETFVDFDQSLNSAIRRLRVALDDSPRQPVYVGTVPRVGFRFLAEVRRASATAAEMADDAGAEMDEVPVLVAPRLLPALLSVGATASNRWPVWSFLVLFGMVAGGCGVLASEGASRVGGWFGVGRMGTAADAGTAFLRWDAGAGGGTAQGAGDDGVGAPGAVDGGAGRGNLTTLPEPSARGRGRLSDAGALLPVLVRAEPGRDVTGSERLTELTGWYHLGLRTEMDYGLARHAFAQAAAADPKAATPLVGLAEAEILMALNGSAPAERLRAARVAGEKAVRLAPELADAHAVVGAVEALERWDLPSAERDFRVALALDPQASLPRLWMAVFVMLPEHRYTEAEAETRRVMRDAPISLTAHTNLGWIFFAQGRRAEAMEQYRFVLSVNPEFVPARFHLAQLLRAEGRGDEARRMLPSDPAAPGDVAEMRHRGMGGAAGAKLGAAEGVAAQRCEQLWGEYNGGGTDEMSTIRAAVRDRCSNFFFFGQDPAFDSVRGEPEFAALEQTAFTGQR